jgi:hypothetical protein
MDVEAGLDQRRGRRKGVVGRRRGADDEVDVGRRQAGVVEGRARSFQAEHRGRLVLGRDVALLDAGALHDPLVRGLDPAGEIVVGDDPFGEVRAAAADDGAKARHEQSFTPTPSWVSVRAFRGWCA